MEIDIRLITEGNCNGEDFYICDFRYNDYSKKPIRNVKPTKVMAVCNSMTNKVIYYSNSHFVAYKECGNTLSSKVIAIFDNTGFRHRTGEPLNVFNNMNDCKEMYNKQLKQAISGLKKEKKKRTIDISNTIKRLQSQINA